MKSVSIPLVLFAMASAAPANTAPTVVIQSAAMRPGTTLMDVVYRVNDPDDATVKTRALAFVDGLRSFAKVLRPVTFVDGTAAKLGDAIATNADHTLTWDVAADWDIDLGQVKFEVLAMDGRGLLPFDWITIPAAGENPELTISKDTPSTASVLDAYFWQYASGDPGLILTNGVVNGSPGSGLFEGIKLVDGTTIQTYGTPYILKQMNLRAGDRTAANYAVSARAAIANTTSWHALSEPWQDFDLIVGWGRSTSGVITIPAGLANVTAIAAGLTHSLALLGDGTVVQWGSLPLGSTPLPPGLSNVTAIAAGQTHSLALLSNGTVVGWGRDNLGQATPPPGLANVTAIAAGQDYSLALLINGTVVGWGSNSFNRATPPEGLATVTAMAAGTSQSLARLNNGTVVGWGGGLQATPPPGLANVTAIAAGGVHSLARLSNGTVVAWGASYRWRHHRAAGTRQRDRCCGRPKSQPRTLGRRHGRRMGDEHGRPSHTTCGTRQRDSNFGRLVSQPGADSSNSLNHDESWQRVDWPPASATMRKIRNILLCVGLLPATLSAATVNFVQNAVNDVDAGSIGAVSSNQYLETSVTYSTVTAPVSWSGYRFTHWSNSSYPGSVYRDAWGRSLNPVSFVLLEDTTCTAHYLPLTLDSDSDGVPDWFEIEYYGQLGNAAASDTDGDGISMLQESQGGTHPLYADTSQAGGVAYADSGMVTVNLGGFSRYTLRSDPAGTVDQSEVVETGTVVTTPDLTANAAFGYWTLDGVRQQDAWGVALPQISFTMGTEDREAVAYLFTGDSDGDGVPDAYEQYYYGTLANDAASDTDGDGISLLAEYTAGSNPFHANILSGGWSGVGGLRADHGEPGRFLPLHPHQ